MKKKIDKVLRFIFDPVIIDDHVPEQPVTDTAPVSEILPAAPKDYTLVARADAHAAFFTAVLEDDTGTMNQIHAAYPSAPTWLSPIDPSSTSSSQPIPLIHYAALGNGDALRWFIVQGVDVETVDDFWFKCTPLYLAAQRNNTVTIKILLAAGADPYVKSLYKDYYDMIEEATRFGGKGSAETVALLREARQKAAISKKPPLVARRESSRRP